VKHAFKLLEVAQYNTKQMLMQVTITVGYWFCEMNMIFGVLWSKLTQHGEDCHIELCPSLQLINVQVRSDLTKQ